MVTDYQEQDALAEAWRASGLAEDEYVAAAHAFVCHHDDPDPSACQGKSAACPMNRGRRDMLDLANDVRADGGDLDDLTEAWSRRAPN